MEEALDLSFDRLRMMVCVSVSPLLLCIILASCVLCEVLAELEEIVDDINVMLEHYQT